MIAIFYLFYILYLFYLFYIFYFLEKDLTLGGMGRQKWGNGPGM